MADERRLEAMAFEIFEGLREGGLSPPDVAEVVVHLTAMIAYTAGQTDDGQTIDAIARSAKIMQQYYLDKEKH